MASFLLVHGAWHGGWCWDPVAARLRDRGHAVEAPDLPGRGGLALYTDHLGQFLDRLAPPVLLVGHSQGGVVITEAAERYAGRVAALVYLAAFLPQSGHSLVDTLRGNNVRMPLPFLTVSADRAYTHARQDALQEYLYHDCPPELLLLAQSRLRPEPMALSTDKVTTTPERYGRIPRAYIECTADRAIPVALQRAMHQAAACSPVLSLPMGHAGFFADPEPLVALLHGLAGSMPLPSTH